MNEQYMIFKNQNKQLKCKNNKFWNFYLKTKKIFKSVKQSVISESIIPDSFQSEIISLQRPHFEKKSQISNSNHSKEIEGLIFGDTSNNINRLNKKVN